MDTNSKKIILSIILLMNLADLVFTIGFVEGGYATEANPFMAFLIEKSPLIFAVGKISLVSFGVALLWNFKTKGAFYAACLVACCYSLVLVVHGTGIIHLAQISQ